MSLIVIKSREEVEKIRRACLVVAEVLERLREEVKPGVTTWDLNQRSEEIARQKKARPAFKGYRGYPYALCTSVNEEIVHGMPSKKRVLKEGDIISLDFGVVVDGFYGDAAVTVPVGKVSERAQRLCRVTEEALYKGIEKVRVGNHLSDISHAIQSHVERAFFGGERVCRSWDRAPPPRESSDSELRPPRARSTVKGGHGLRH